MLSYALMLLPLALLLLVMTACFLKLMFFPIILLSPSPASMLSCSFQYFSPLLALISILKLLHECFVKLDNPLSPLYTRCQKGGPKV